MIKENLTVMHLVSGSLSGGAARGAYWLHQGLLKKGIQSFIYTNSPVTYSDSTVISISGSSINRAISIFRSQLDINIPKLIYRGKVNKIFSTGMIGSDITKSKEYKRADIIHLHWINGGFFDIAQLKKIKKPIIWTLRDMWPMTGGCHYSMECNNFENGCGQCPQLGSNSKLDISKFIFNRKARYYPDHMAIVGVSTWISNMARRSNLLSENTIKTINNNIDTNSFTPINKEEARKLLKIKTNKKIILLGATSIKDFYKGFHKFVEAVKQLDPKNYFLLFFGNVDNNIVKELNFEFMSLGYIYDTLSLRVAYSAADVFVAPSIMEAFGKTIIESMSCSTPVVCFDATGPKDIVEHLHDGYKAEPFCSHSLAVGIKTIAMSPNYDIISKNSRESIIRKFDTDVIAEKYVELYYEVLTPK